MIIVAKNARIYAWHTDDQQSAVLAHADYAMFGVYTAADDAAVAAGDPVPEAATLLRAEAV